MPALLRLLLPLCALFVLPTPARASPQEVTLVLDAFVESSEQRTATQAAHTILYGIAAPQLAGAVEVSLLGPGLTGAASSDLATWLGSVRQWLKADASKWVPDSAIDGIGGGHLIVIASVDDKRWEGLARVLPDRSVTVLSAGDDEGPLAQACAKSSACERVALSESVVPAAAAAVRGALSGIPGVVVTAANRLQIPSATALAVSIWPGLPGAVVDPLGDGGPFPVGPPGDIVSARRWLNPVSGSYPLQTNKADGPDEVSKPVIALSVTVMPRIAITDCSMIDGAPIEWRFTTPTSPTWDDDLAKRVRFEVHARSGTKSESELLKASELGRLDVPDEIAGRFSVQPIALHGKARLPLGESADCQPAPTLTVSTTLTATPSDDAIEVRASFTDPDGLPLAATEVLGHAVAEVVIDTGAKVALELVGEQAIARFEGLRPGNYRVTLQPASSRALSIGSTAVTASVGSPPREADGAPWWVGVLAAALAFGSTLAWPVGADLIRRRQSNPRGKVALYVGGSLVNERALDDSTAFPVLLAGLRELPIANGEVLARVEVVWQGWRPTVRALVVGARDGDNGVRVNRVESRALSAATPFEFSNVRVEFVADG